ncbi:MAG: 4'-phosphopantetheinyl transferase family protein, partial [Vicinamibacterales bacterium]
QYARFHFARDARDYAAAHALLRTVLSRDGDRGPRDWRFDKTPHGKPYLIDPGEFRGSFSLSHTHGMVACVVTGQGDIGVDVERVDRDLNLEDIARRYFAPAEARLLAQLEPDAQRSRFFEFWTLKEALVKALGVGIATSLASFAFTVDADGGIALGAPAGIVASDWQFGLFAPSPRHRLAVAARRSPARRTQLILRSLASEA